MEWTRFNELPLWQQEMIYLDWKSRMPDGWNFDPESIIDCDDCESEEED